MYSEVKKHQITGKKRVLIWESNPTNIETLECYWFFLGFLWLVFGIHAAEV